MEENNRERRRIQTECFDSCMEEAERILAINAKSFLLLKPNVAHEGVSGIVAGKVREQTGLPCAVLAETSGGLLKGSARSAGHLDLIALLRRHEELFTKLGGHAMAAGFSLLPGNVKPLAEALTQDLQTQLSKDPLLLEEPETTDAVVQPQDLDIYLAKALYAMEPVGAGNPAPKLAFRTKTSAIGGIKHMGNDSQHLRFTADGVPCVYFNGKGQMPESADSMEIAGTLEINVWQNRANLQFNVSSVSQIGI